MTLENETQWHSSRNISSANMVYLGKVTSSRPLPVQVPRLGLSLHLHLCLDPCPGLSACVGLQGP